MTKILPLTFKSTNPNNMTVNAENGWASISIRKSNNGKKFTHPARHELLLQKMSKISQEVRQENNRDGITSIDSAILFL